MFTLQDRIILIKFPVILIAILIVVTLPVFGDATSEKNAWEQFAIGLELHIDKKTDKALQIMENIVFKYPNTEAAEKAKVYIENSKSKLDRSGIISFYLGNMLTATWSAFSIPIILDLDDGYVPPISGIIGVGSGIYTSWLMSRNIDMSLGRDLWIEFIEAVSITNFQYAYSIFGEYITDFELRGKINIGGQTATALTSRGLTYSYVKDKYPSAGKVFTVINTYAWSQYYLWLTLSEIFNSQNDNLNYSLGILLPDLAAAGSYFLWDKAGWSMQRTGIISVSGIAGMLTGIFVDMILNEADINPSNAVTSAIVMSGSLSGKIIGAYVTSGMEPDAKADESLFSNMNFTPIVTKKGTGFMINMHL